ncbi:MAG: type I-E CRISPR-associated protein Cse2/CasB [Chloroflexi bacterium]|nr:type I-E CRISPR-associated protein Cse2/CasB [Chloroflexota bacterium]
MAPSGPERSGVAARKRAALAELRRGLGVPPGQAAEMYPYVVPWLPDNAQPWQEEPYYLVAALFAWHQRPWPKADGERRPTNLGASFARLAQAVESESIERRFTALLSSHRDDLPEQLRHAVGLLKSKDVPIDWAQLLADIQQWDRPRRTVQRGWARAFWGSVRSTSEARQASGEGAPSTEQESSGTHAAQEERSE